MFRGVFSLYDALRISTWKLKFLYFISQMHSPHKKGNLNNSNFKNNIMGREGEGTICKLNLSQLFAQHLKLFRVDCKTYLI